MKTILLPTDFSESARNALQYALGFARQTAITNIILYNAYQPSPVLEPVVSSVDFYELEAFKKISEEGLAALQAEITAGGNLPFSIECISECNSVIGGIYAVMERVNIDLIIMGISVAGKLDELLSGSQEIYLARHTPLPLLMVPAGSVFSPVNKVVLACDLQEVIETTPVSFIKNLLQTTGARLLILHATHEDKSTEPGMPFESLMLEALFKEYHPEFHFTGQTDFTEGINQFANEQEADLIINIPKKHGFLEEIFRHSHTKKLVLHSSRPLLLVHK